jgi:GTP cyclohydrolase I
MITIEGPLNLELHEDEEPTPTWALREMLKALFEEDINNDPSLRKTPFRIWKMWNEFFQPFNPVDVMTTFDCDSTDLVVQTKIPVRSLCEHHFLPFFGHAAIGYVPDGQVIGLSKFARLVKGLGMRRPTIQENLTQEIADALWKHLGPKGVIVVMSAEHTCMTVRGAQAPGVQTMTSAVRGIFETDSDLRSEFFDLLEARPNLG